jgi:hypothetical protein
VTVTPLIGGSPGSIDPFPFKSSNTVPLTDPTPQGVEVAVAVAGVPVGVLVAVRVAVAVGVGELGVGVNVGGGPCNPNRITTGEQSGNTAPAELGVVGV